MSRRRGCLREKAGGKAWRRVVWPAKAASGLGIWKIGTVAGSGTVLLVFLADGGSLAAATPAVAAAVNAAIAPAGNILLPPCAACPRGGARRRESRPAWVLCSLTGLNTNADIPCFEFRQVDTSPVRARVAAALAGGRRRSVRYRSCAMYQSEEVGPIWRLSAWCV